MEPEAAAAAPTSSEPSSPIFASATIKIPAPRGEMMDHKITYPLQPRSQYVAPSQFLSFESKRVIRQAQDPLYVTAPRVSHFLYEVISDDQLHVASASCPKDCVCLCFMCRLLLAQFDHEFH